MSLDPDKLVADINADYDCQCWAGEIEDVIASLRSRLALFEEHVCRGCGCAVVEAAHLKLCEDCDEVRYGPAPHALERYDDHDRGAIASACISAGLRALCGRRILEGVE